MWARVLYGVVAVLFFITAVGLVVQIGGDDVSAMAVFAISAPLSAWATELAYRALLFSFSD
jgi:hypothetical protein